MKLLVYILFALCLAGYAATGFVLLGLPVAFFAGYGIRTFIKDFNI